MKTLIMISFVAMMTWQPSCDPANSPTSSSSSDGYTGYYQQPTEYRTLVRGTIVDDDTGAGIDSVRVCRDGACYITSTKWYSFYVTSSSIPDEIQVNVSHPGYLPDSVVLTLQGGTLTHDFRLKR